MDHGAVQRQSDGPADGGRLSTDSFLATKIQPFQQMHYIEVPRGYIVWRRGTGDNIELLHLKAYVPRQGTGRWLLKEMLKYLAEDPPYYSVFGFTRYDNREACEFYRRMGFNLSYFAGVYADRKSILFHASFEELRIHHGV